MLNRFLFSVYWVERWLWHCSCSLTSRTTTRPTETTIFLLKKRDDNTVTRSPCSGLQQVYIFLQPGEFPQGCQAFKCISPNVQTEESGMRDDAGMQDVQYTEVSRLVFFACFFLRNAVLRMIGKLHCALCTSSAMYFTNCLIAGQKKFEVEWLTMPWPAVKVNCILAMDACYWWPEIQFLVIAFPPPHRISWQICWSSVRCCSRRLRDTSSWVTSTDWSFLSMRGRGTLRWGRDELHQYQVVVCATVKRANKNWRALS